MSDKSTKSKLPAVKTGSGGVYYAHDESGKVFTSPSYAGLVADLEAAQVAKERAAKREHDRVAAIEALKADAAERLADLEPRLQAAQESRDAAYETFKSEALSGGAFIEPYAEWVALHRRAGALKNIRNEALHESRFGQHRNGAPVEPRTPPLAEALQNLVDLRVEEIRKAAK